LYERVTAEDGNVTIDASGIKNCSPKLAALATVGGPQNQSFLATVNATLSTDDFGPDLAAVLTWFKESLQLVGPDAALGPIAHVLDQDPQFLAFASEFLKGSSTGVDHLALLKQELSHNELKRLIPASLVNRILEEAKQDKGSVIAIGDGDELVFEPGGGSQCYQIRVQAAHERTSGKVVNLDLSDESDGTRRLLHLIPALHKLHSDEAVFFIDEIDRSLHPILVRKFLEFFLQVCSAGNRQVIVTTHESSLLDQELLRRDEIWFAEKDQSLATHLYSLVDFKVRNDLEIRKHYLQGRFGAVPFIGGLDGLLSGGDQCR
jgi:hypothetical protein